MITETDRRIHTRRRRRRRSVRVNAATTLLLTRAAWRMYRGRSPWHAGRRLLR